MTCLCCLNGNTSLLCFSLTDLKGFTWGWFKTLHWIPGHPWLLRELLADVPILLDSKGPSLPIWQYRSPRGHAVPQETSVCALGTAFQQGRLTQKWGQGYQAAKLQWLRQCNAVGIKAAQLCTDSEQNFSGQVTKPKWTNFGFSNVKYSISNDTKCTGVHK